MSASVSLSPTPRAQPPRSNPFARSSSDAPPLPCVTPSRVIWVMVVSFTIAFLRLGAAPRGRPHPCYERRPPDPTPPPEISWDCLLALQVGAELPGRDLDGRLTH